MRIAPHVPCKGAAPTTCHPSAFGQQTIAYNGLTTTSNTVVYLENGTTSETQTKAETRLATGKTYKVTDNAGKTITYSYDAVGNVRKASNDADNTSIVTGFDALGRKATSQTHPNKVGATTSTYDALGQLKSQTDPNGSVSKAVRRNKPVLRNSVIVLRRMCPLKSGIRRNTLHAISRVGWARFLCPRGQSQKICSILFWCIYPRGHLKLCLPYLAKNFPWRK